MKANKCPSCGASLNGNENTCPYCNTSYKKDDQKISIEIIQPSNEKQYSTRSQEEVIHGLLNLKNRTKNKSLSTAIPLVIVAVIAASMLFTMGSIVRTSIIVGDGVSIFEILPLIIISFGVISVFVSTLSKPSQRYLNNAIKHLQNGKIDEAFAYAKSKAHATKTLLGVAIIIAFYLKQDYVFASVNIRRINGYTFTEFEQYTDLLTNAAFELDYIPPTR